SASVLPRLGIAERRPLRRWTRFPRLAARLVRRRNRVEAPGFLAAARVVRRDESADPVLPAADADDDLVFYRERRERHRVARLAARDLDVPQRTAALRVDGDEMGVQGSHIQRVAEHREPAVVRTAADDRGTRDRVPIDPEHTP